MAVPSEQPERDETPSERYDRNLLELLQELRVAIPGVQVLFAFLLTVPFAQRFGAATAFQVYLYFATLLCAAAASALLIAPSAYHRVRFRKRDKRHIVEVSNRMVIAGLGVLGLAITGAVWLVSDVLFGTAVTAIAAGGTALLIFGLWYALPLSRRASGD
jgi:hypothetical protein